ncbi:hypothetical protein FQN49_008367 [Arthroderma sp. PD_2]|nr:hypothetical protein FQN49_008367 [Arthroderma sp. PD_2]
MRVSSALAVFVGLCATAVAGEPKVIGYFHSPNGSISPFPVTVHDGVCESFHDVWIMSADLPDGYDCVFYSQLHCNGRETDHYTKDVSRFKFEVRSFVCSPVSDPTPTDPTPSDPKPTQSEPSQSDPQPTATPSL